VIRSARSRFGGPAPGPVAALALSLLVGSAGCATGGIRPGRASAGARDGLDAWLAGDPALAERTFRSAADRDPDDAWAHAGLALVARRALDPRAEVASLVAAVRARPDDPIALTALERLAELAGPGTGRAIEAGLAPLAAEGRLRGIAAYRARAVRVSAADGLGEPDRVVALRGENGLATAWTVAGPFSASPGLDFDRALPVDRGTFPAEAPVLPGAVPAPARAVPIPDGMLTLGSDTGEAGLLLLGAEARLARGGRYLVVLWCLGSASVSVDGAPVAERRELARHDPVSRAWALDLAPGLHRVIVRFAPPADRGGLAVALARADGAPSDVAWSPLAPGPVPPAVAGAKVGAAEWSTRRLEGALEPAAGPVAARFLAARAMRRYDREGAKALLAEALATAPDAAPLHAALADALDGDPTLDPQAARARAEAALRRVLARDPGEAEARIELASLQRRADRAADAEALLEPLAPPVADRSDALVARAEVARSRGAPEEADRLARAAADQGSCAAMEQLHDSAAAREAVAEVDALARALAACRGGTERLVRHLVKRGDAAGARAAAAPTGRSRPAAIEPALVRAALELAAGDGAAALRELEAPLRAWPRSTRLWKRVATLRELAGDRDGARAARERALALDGSDLGLRRALALAEGREVLDGAARDGGAAIREWEASGRAADTSTTLVLDSAAVEFHADGSFTERTHQVVHVTDQRGVDKYGETHLPPGAELLTLRTRKRDGRILEPDGGRAKGSTSLAALEPGDYAEVEYLRAQRGAPEGGSAEPFYFQNEGERLFESTYSVSAPAAIGLELDAHGLEAPPLAREGDRVSARVTRRDVPGLVAEPYAPPNRELFPSLQAGYGSGRELLQRRVGEVVLARTRPTAELEALAREVRAAAGPGAGGEALARAAHAAVAGRVRGGGAGLGSDASEVLSRGRGGRTLLLECLLDLLGVEARVVLVRRGEEEPVAYRFAGAWLYSMALLRVRADGRELWLDAEPRNAPFGALSAGVLDAEGLVLPAPGEAPAVARTPRAATVPSRREQRLRFELDADGAARLVGRDTYAGDPAGDLRDALERFDASLRRRIFEEALAGAFRGLRLGSLELRGLDDREAEMGIDYEATIRGFARRDVTGALRLETPIFPLGLGQGLARVGERKLPLDFVAGDPALLRAEIVAPEGMVPVARPDVELATRWGQYRRTERIEGRTLVREERWERRRARIPPGDYPAFAAFLAAVDAAQAEPVRVELVVPR
jgi:hypothetical protein